MPGIRAKTGTAAVGLTFDACGGPRGSGVDQDLLNILRTRQIPVTLFFNTRWVVANPTLARELASDPRIEIGNHGAEHRPLSVHGQAAYGIPGTPNLDALVEEVMSSQKVLTDLTGRPPRFFRPGTAYLDDIAVEVVRDLGMEVAGFELNLDAGATASARTVAKNLTGVKPGAIILGHMNHPGSGTAAGVTQALPALLSRGVQFTRLSG